MAQDLVTTREELAPGRLGGGGFWAILDATDIPTLPDRMDEPGTEARCLYEGDLVDRYRNCAPYLARFDASLYKWLLKWLADDPWGIVFTSAKDMDALAKHFRRSIIVRDTRGRRLLFRFYDPRVLRAFLPTCKPKELAEFYGPVDEFWTPIGGTEFDIFTRQGEPTEARG